MNAWRSVALESSCGLLAHVGLTGPVTVGLLGDAEDAAAVTAASRRPPACRVALAFRQPDLSLAELPTLSMLHAWARRQRPPRPVLYLHTKGVSRPADRSRTAWRRLMQRHVVADWATHIPRLATDVDLVGVDWFDSAENPHFSGNVWLARSDWVAALDPPGVYRLSRPADLVWGRERWRDRMFCETWIGSRPGARLASLACRNVKLWEGSDVYAFDTAVPGFAYDD